MESFLPLGYPLLQSQNDLISLNLIAYQKKVQSTEVTGSFINRKTGIETQRQGSKISNIVIWGAKI